MKKTISIFLLLLSAAIAHADLTNLVISWKREDGINATKSLSIAANQEATILSVLRSYETGAWPPSSGVTNLVVVESVPIRIVTPDEEPIPRSPLPLRISGPAEIRIRALVGPDSLTTGDAVHVMVVDIRDKNPTGSPSGAVVIPTDAIGPVKILLESSVDLLNWTEALPGTYGASATKRFFRVRAIAL